MEKRNVFLAILLTVSFFLKSQSKYDKDFYLIDIKPDYVFNPGDKHDIDSILKLYHATANDTMQLEFLRLFSEGLSDEYLWPKYNRYLYEKSLQKNDSLFKFFRACALNNIGYESQYILGNNEEAKKKYLESYNIFKEINHGSGLGVEINNLAYLYQHEGNIQKSVELYTEAATFFEKLKQPLGLTSIYINLGDICFNNDEIEKASEYFNKALFNALQTDQKSVKGNAYNQLGALSIRKNEPKKAIDYYKKALYLYEQDNNYAKQALICFGLANAYKLVKNKTLYEEYTLKSYTRSLLTGDLQIKAKVFDRVASLYLYKKEFKMAEAFADSSYQLGKKLLYPELVADAALSLSEIYSRTNNFNKAFTFLKEAKVIQDSLKTEASKKSIIRSQYQMEYNKKSIELKSEQDKKDAIRKSEKQQQQIILTLTLIALTIILIFAGIAFKNYKKAKKQNIIIESQRQEVLLKNAEVTAQKSLIEEKQKEIIDSITYAKRLQEAILPPKAFIESLLPDTFIFYKPKDLVAGDFYWAEKMGDLFFIAAADSTGHGVPGAMVSVVCSNALNRSVKEFNLLETGKILDKTRELVIETFERKDAFGENKSGDVKDGMDISLLCIDLKNKKLSWSGANNPLWYISDNHLTEIKGDKQAIGKTDNPKPFTTHAIDYKEKTTLYLFTDGLADQFGGPNGKKFKYKQFSELLLKNGNLSANDQFKAIDLALMEWKGELEQVDDVCVIGIRI